MYFIVLIKNCRQRRIVPKPWIMKIDEHFEKFLNRGLNRNQTFIVFWTTNIDAFDKNGVPKLSYMPNFKVSRSVQFPNEGIYECNVLQCKSKLIILRIIIL